MSVKTKIKKYPKTSAIILFFVATYLFLLIPANYNSTIQEGNKKAFIWNRDSVWKNLEQEFINVGINGCDKIKFLVDSLVTNFQTLLNKILVDSLNPSDKKFIILEENIFKIAPLIPACVEYFPDYINFYSNLRIVVKEQSRWKSVV